MIITIDTNLIQDKKNYISIVRMIKKYIRQSYKEAIKEKKSFSAEILLKDLCTITKIEKHIKSLNNTNTQDINIVCFNLSKTLNLNVKKFILSYLLEYKVQNNMLINYINNQITVINTMIKQIE